jgi:hypothetical protein
MHGAAGNGRENLAVAENNVFDGAVVGEHRDQHLPVAGVGQVVGDSRPFRA